MLKKDIYDKVKTIKESNINLQVRNINFQMNLNYSESFILKNIYLLFINSLKKFINIRRTLLDY